jgi:uncharacterized OB-fold protein
MSGFTVRRDDASAPFYDATAESRLLIRRCPACGTAYPPQQRRCRDGEELRWEEASGQAVLISWAVDHTPPLDDLLASPDGQTATYGLVELAEGPWLQVPIVNASPTSLAEGIAMRVLFIRPGDGEQLPAFTPGRTSTQTGASP